MKLKKGLIVIISIILMCISTQSFAWIAGDATYEVCNMINICISGTMKLVVFMIVISYITIAIRHIRFSEQEPQQKIKNLRIWLIITIMQIAILLFGASWVIKVGMETYTYSAEGIYQSFDINTLISNAIRIIAFVLIVFYIIKSIIYFVQSEQENKQKIINLIKWQIVTAIIVVVLLLFARNW